jgi:HK97 family phage prohead protease
MANELLHRTFTPDLEVRSKGDGRTVVGIAVPYNRPQRINDHLTEEFVRGAFNHQMKAANRVSFARDHIALGGTLIGCAKMLRDDASGLYGEWRVSNTPTGNDTLELMKDGALRELSVGFRERRDGNRRAGNVTQRVKADLFEVAVVLEGAYGAGATVSAVRAAMKVPPMGTDTYGGDPDPAGGSMYGDNDTEPVITCEQCGHPIGSPLGAPKNPLGAPETRNLDRARQLLASIPAPLLSSVSGADHGGF